MTFHLTSSTTINGPLEEIFYYVTNSENDPDWWPAVKESKCVTEVKRGVGAGYQQKAVFLGRKFDNYFECIEYDPPRRIKWTGGETMIPFIAEMFFEPIDDKSFRIRFEADLRAPKAFRIIEPLAVMILRKQSDGFFTKLKQVAESRQFTPATV
jgi:uncharacterized protein YndB with AHSA1/START domain